VRQQLEDEGAMIAEGGEYASTPAVSHPILTYNRGRKTGLADGIVMTPSHNPPNDGGFNYWRPIAERNGLNLIVVNEAVDPTFRFMTVDGSQIRMDLSSPYAMQRLIGTITGWRPHALSARQRS